MDNESSIFSILRHLFSANAYDDDDDDDGEDDRLPTFSNSTAPSTTPPHPQKNLLDHELHAEILSTTGTGPAGPGNNSIWGMVRARELGLSRNPYRSPFSAPSPSPSPSSSSSSPSSSPSPSLSPSPTPSSSLQEMDCSPFSPKSKTHITQRFIPNNPTQLATYADAVFCGMFSHDGSLYMTACKDENIRIYDTQTWKKVKTVRARNVGWSIISTDYSPDQKWLIYSSWSNYVHLANTSGTHEVHEALDFKPSAHRFCLFSIQFSSDSREILGGSSDRNIYIYDLERRDRVAKIRAHEDDINAVAFSDKSSQILISGSDDSLIKIWDRRTLSKGLPVGILPGHAHGITFIDPKGDSTYIISNSKDQTIKLWDLRTMKGTDFAEPKQNTFQYNSYGPMFMRRPQRRHDPQDQSLMTYEGHQVLQTLIRCRFSPKETTGQRYIYSGSYDGTVYVFDVISGELIRKLSGVRNTMRDVHWHPSLPIIVSCNWNGNVTRWDTDSSLPTHHEANIPPTSSASIRREGIVTQYDEIGDSD